MPDFVNKLRKESKYLLFAQALASLLVGFLSWSGLLVLLDLYDVYSPIQERDAGIWMLAITAFVGGVSFLFLCYIWLSRPSAKVLAQKVESANPELNDLLNTAIEIEQRGEDPKFMEKRVLRELSRKESSLDWHAVLRPSASFWKFLIFGFLLGLALSVWNFYRTPLLKARAAFSDAPGLVIRTSLIGAPEQHWKLADAEFRRGTDISIHAEILRNYRQSEEAWIEWLDGNGTTAFKMLQKDKVDHWEWVFPAFNEPLKYRVVTPSLQGGWHSIEPYDPPQIEFVRWEMIPPAYLKMKSIVHDGLGYIEAPENSQIRLDVRVHDFPENISALLVSSEGNFSLEKTGRVTFTWQGVMDRELSAKISLSDLDHIHRPEIISDEVVISPVPDQPPLVEITDPAKDLQLPYDADPQLIEVLATDDHGVAEIGLWVFHNGIEKEVDLFVDPVAKEKAVTGILDLSEFPLADVDVITYMAFAGDTREPVNQISESQIYFIEIGHQEKDTSPPPPPSDAMGQEVWEIPLRKFINLNRELIKKNKMAMSLDPADMIEPALEICTDAQELKNLMTIVYDDHGESFPVDAGLDTGELFLEAIYDIEQVEVSSGDRDLVEAFKASLMADRKLVQIWGIFNKNKPPPTPGKMKPPPYNRVEVLKKLEAFQKKLENPMPAQTESGPKE